MTACVAAPNDEAQANPQHGPRGDDEGHKALTRDVLFAQVGQHVACLDESAGDGGTIAVEDHRYDRVAMMKATRLLPVMSFWPGPRRLGQQRTQSKR